MWGQQVFKKKEKNMKPATAKPVISKTKLKSRETSLDTKTLEKFEMEHNASNSATGSTFLLLVTLLLVAFAGFVLSVSSLWKILNPELEFSFPNSEVFKQIAQGIDLPEVPADFTDFGSNLDPEVLAETFDGLRENGSELLQQIPSADLAEKYQAVCQKISENYTPQQIADAIERDFIFKVPGLKNHDELADEIVEGALSLCPIDEETQ
jgi:hypothetical protein